MPIFAQAFQKLDGETDDAFAERVAAVLAEASGSAAPASDQFEDNEEY